MNRKLIQKQIVNTFIAGPIDQENPDVELVKQLSSNQNRGNQKSFISPARVLSPRHIANNINFGQRSSMNSIFSRPERVQRPAITRESARRIPTEDILSLKTEESYLGGKNNISVNYPTSTSTKKKIIVFKKFLSKSPESKIPEMEEARHLVTDAVKFLDNFISPKQSLKTKICLNEMITLKKVRETQSGGFIKRMLHAPSLNIYEIHVYQQQSRNIFNYYICDLGGTD